MLAWTTPRDRDDRAASTAFARAFELLSRPGPEPALRLAAAEATDDDDERRRMLEQALDAQPPPPWRALLLARLGVAARAARRDARALEAWREALAIDPTCWPASLAIAQEEADAGLPLTAVTRLEALAAGRAGRCRACGARPCASTTRPAGSARPTGCSRSSRRIGAATPT